MIPNAEQVRAAILNGVQPPRTSGARIQQALEHAKHSKEKAGPEGPAQDIFSETDGVSSAGEQGNKDVHAADYNPPR